MYDIERENFVKKLRRSIEKDAEWTLDFVVIQVPDGDFVQFLPMEKGGFYVEFAVGDSEDSLKGPDDDVPIPVKKRPWLSPEHDKPLVTMLKLLLIGLVGGALFGVVMFVLSEYYW